MHYLDEKWGDHRNPNPLIGKNKKTPACWLL
jgi:hypothetical protein